MEFNLEFKYQRIQILKAREIKVLTLQEKTKTILHNA